MFSGIIEEKAQVTAVLRSPQGFQLAVQSQVASEDARVGDSISVNGVCLTVVRAKGKEIVFDIMEETLRRTSLSELAAGKAVNLERALKLGDRLSGHFVTGHIDCVGKVRAISRRPDECVLDIGFPADKASYLAEKGSIAIDGVSLTVGDIHKNRLKVYLIPLTLRETGLGSKKAGDPVNMEFDLLGKYALKSSPPESKKSKVNISFLREHGFV